MYVPHTHLGNKLDNAGSAGVAIGKAIKLLNWAFNETSITEPFLNFY